MLFRKVTRYKLHATRANSGFTLVELLIYVAISSVVIALFTSILIATTRIQEKQGASASITQELSFIMTTLERYVHSASDFTIEEGGNGLTVILDATTNPPTTKSVSLVVPGTIQLTETDPQNGTVISDLSSSKILINSLTFTDLSNGGSKSVRMKITASASTTNPSKQATHNPETTTALYMQKQ